MSNKTLITLFIALYFCSAAVMAETPEGWNMKGPSSYESGVDNSIYLSSPQSFYLRSTASKSYPSGELFQVFSAGQYAGKRVKLTGFVKGNLTHAIAFGIVVWRGSEHAIMAGEESLHSGETYYSWTQLTTVIDVPIDSNKISIFFRMWNKGEAWLDDIKLEIVNKSTPLLNLHDDFIESNGALTNLP